MNKIGEILQSVGLWPEEKEETATALNATAYDQKGVEELKIHRDFLQSLYEDEKDRQKAIEAKTSQLFSQTGLIFAVMGLFIPMIIDKVDLLGLKIGFLTVLFFASLFYLLTINNAARTLNIKNYRYQNPNLKDVLNLKDSSTEEFIAEHIRSLLSVLPDNATLNNRKGTNLLRAHRAFKVANILTTILASTLCLSLIITAVNKKPLNIRIENPVETIPLKEVNANIKNGSEHLKTESETNTNTR